MRNDRDQIGVDTRQVRHLLACIYSFNNRCPHIQRLTAGDRRYQKPKTIDIRARSNLPVEMTQLFRRDIFEFSRKLPMQGAFNICITFRDPEIDENGVIDNAVPQDDVVW